MSQPHVERVIGLLATDECFRRRFMKDPRSALLEVVQKGMELTASEIWSLASLDRRELTRFAEAIDARLQKVDPEGGDP